MMFIPKKFEVTDFNDISQFIAEHSFGIIVSQKDRRPIATHVPLLLREIEGTNYVTGHLAKANEQWKTFNEVEEVLVIFQGPHSYVSSSWYNHENVPTWNYQSVHIYGKINLMSKEELIEDLSLLMEKYESHREKPILWDSISDDTKKQINAIVGFKISCDEIQAAFKLSQNRNAEDFNNVIKNLNEEEDPQAKQIAKAMEKINKR